MNLSYNEVEAVAKRATFGAGYTWGIAEEAAKATRWLCLYGLDGCKALADLLTANLPASLSSHTPVPAETEWSGKGDLCPLTTGVVLSDNALMLKSREIITLNRVISPELILPFVSYASLMAEDCIYVKSMEYSKTYAIVCSHSVQLESEFPTDCESLIVHLGGIITKPQQELKRVSPNQINWDKLNEFANLTYAPATEESRSRGAGAGLTDND